MAKPPPSFFSPGYGLLSSVYVLMTSPVPSSLAAMLSMSSIWDDDKISHFNGSNGWCWCCGYCGTTWAYVNTSWVIRHLVPTHSLGKGIGIFPIPFQT
jgi:hypothetical protein